MARNLTPWNWFKSNENENNKRRQISRLGERGPFPSGLYSDMERMMNEMFDEYLPIFQKERSMGYDLDFITPKINISETENEYKMSAEMPGVKENDIDLRIDKGILTLKAEKKEEKEEKDERYHRLESYYGTFQRSIALPEDIKEDSIEAKFKNGILNIIIKKSKESKPDVKKIAVKSE